MTRRDDGPVGTGRSSGGAADAAAVFATYPDAVRDALLVLRRLIFDTADGIEGVGAIEETVKWGQPSYLTSQTRSGSTIRIAPTSPDSAHDYAMYFICRTNLVPTFYTLFGDVFTYEKDRALLFRVGESLPTNELRECVAMALTYHLSNGREPGPRTHASPAIPDSIGPAGAVSAGYPTDGALDDVQA